MQYLTIRLKTAIKKYGKNEKLEGENQSKNTFSFNGWISDRRK